MGNRVSQARETKTLVEQAPKLVRFLEKLTQKGFFGTITLHFQNGKICRVNRDETYKPEDLPVI